MAYTVNLEERLHSQPARLAALVDNPLVLAMAGAMTAGTVTASTVSACTVTACTMTACTVTDGAACLGAGFAVAIDRIGRIGI
jgi:hypothetical protein